VKRVTPSENRQIAPQFSHEAKHEALASAGPLASSRSTKPCDSRLRALCQLPLFALIRFGDREALPAPPHLQGRQSQLPAVQRKPLCCVDRCI
jgi:hypothetical protein